MRFENYHEAVLSLPDRLFLQLGLDEENLFTDSSSSQIAELYQHIDDFDDHQCYITVYEKMISYIDSSIAVISPTMKKYTNLYRSSETTFL